MDEVVFYSPQTIPGDKLQQSAFAYGSSLHTSKQYTQFRQCSSSNHATYHTGAGSGSRFFQACADKALLNVFLWGKESPDQRMPLPEELTCLVGVSNGDHGLPWLLIGGSKSGRLYIWEAASGLLLRVKEAHYQRVSCLKVSSEGNFLISSGDDSRVLIWRIHELVNLDAEDNVKYVSCITDHTLPITDIALSKSVESDELVITSSKDGTVRSYHLVSQVPQTTFVCSSAVSCTTIDPAQRCLYICFESGIIKQVPLYQVNRQGILEAVGGAGKIVTVSDEDDALSHHQPAAPTAATLSMDGTLLVSGDNQGRVFVCDVITKQVIRQLKTLNASVSHIAVFQVAQESLEQNAVKSSIGVPTLKRVLCGEKDLVKHEVYKNDNPFGLQSVFDVEDFRERAKEQEFFFKGDSDAVNENNGKASSKDRETILDLERQVSQLSEGYAKLRGIHEELFTAHAKLVSERK